ncbi:MAG: Spy/CpxP family protein refolding chaperone [Armatimonadota bacterium]
MRNLLLRQVLGLIIGIFTVSTVAFCQTQPQPTRVEPSPCPLMALRFIRLAAVSRLTKDLNLTEEQVTRVTEILKSSGESVRAKIEEQRRAVSDFVTVLANPKASESEMVESFEKAVRSESAIAAELVRAMIAVREVLTEEQKAAFAKMLELWTNPWKGKPVPVLGQPATTKIDATSDQTASSQQRKE